MAAQRSLIILLLDARGQDSPVADAVRRAGHQLVLATGLETAEIVLGSMTPDVAVIRATTADRDRHAISRLELMAPAVPIRVLTDAGFPAAVDDAFSVGPTIN